MRLFHKSEKNAGKRIFDEDPNPPSPFPVHGEGGVAFCYKFVITEKSPLPVRGEGTNSRFEFASRIDRGGVWPEEFHDFYDLRKGLDVERVSSFYYIIVNTTLSPSPHWRGSTPHLLFRWGVGVRPVVCGGSGVRPVVCGEARARPRRGGVGKIID